MSSVFYGVFWYHSNSMMNREGTKRCPVVYGSEIWVLGVTKRGLLIHLSEKPGTWV